MKNKFVFIVNVFLIFSGTCFSQAKQYNYYFDKDLNSASQANAVFYGKGIYQSSGLFEFRLYNSLNKNLISIEHYTDSSLQVNEGLVESFYKNNMLETRSNYVAGKPEGLRLKWDSAGRILDSLIYDKGEKINETAIGYHKNGIIDSFVTTNFKMDTYERKYYDDSARLNADISFAGQKGLVKYYDKGNLTSTDSVFSRLEIEAEFPGGNIAWNKYIVKGLQNNADKIIKSGDYGTCVVKFIVGKDGKIREAQATTMKGTVLAAVAVDIIANGPKWHPANQFGRAVNAYRLQPVTLNQPN